VKPRSASTTSRDPDRGRYLILAASLRMQSLVKGDAVELGHAGQTRIHVPHALLGSGSLHSARRRGAV
jgi:hypothetical protein